MSLKQVVEQIVADAFLAGAEWHAMRSGQDSAAVGRDAQRWQRDYRYQQLVQQQQKSAADAVGRAITALVMGPHERQATLF